MVDQLADQLADQPVVFLEHDVDHPGGNRLDRWWAGWAVGGSVYLPLVMVDSGDQCRSGSIDFAWVYGRMVESAMARPAQARLEVERERDGNAFRFSVEVTNLSGVTLGSANDATLTAIVYEERQVGETGRWVRAAGSTPIAGLAPGATRSYTLQVNVPSSADWSRLHTVVLAEYRPASATGPYDMLQAAHQ